MLRGLKTCPLAFAALLAAAVGGCKATMSVQQYPACYDPDLKSVAVVEFANGTLRPRAGEFLTDRLAAALKANGTYAVVGPGELKGRLRAAGLELPAGADAKTTAGVLRRLGGVQAFLTGSVRAFSAERTSYVEVEHVHFHGGYHWRRPRYGFRYHYPLYRHYVYTRAHAAADAALVRVADGETIYATPSPVSARLGARDDPPWMLDEYLTEAADAVADGLVEAFAVVPKQLRLDAGKLLRTARRREDGRLKFTDDFRAGDEELVVVLRLPPTAARNEFRLAAARKDQEQAVTEEQFLWSAKDRSREFVFSPRKLAEAAGPGKFQVRFYSGRQLVLKRGFEIKAK